MATAVLVIDVQRALSTGIEAAFEADRVIAAIDGLCVRARAAGTPVIFVQHEEQGGALEPGSEGWQLADGLVALPGDPRVGKTTPDAFHGTDLEVLLREKAIDHVVACGFQTDCCIDATVRRAVSLGYEVTLVADGHSTVNGPGSPASEVIASHNASLGALGVRVACAAEINFGGA